MKHILIIIFIISGWAASAQVKFTQMERDTVKWTIPVAHRSIPGIAGYVMKYLSYSDLLDSLGVTADSIYISGDTIYLRDGSGFVKLAAGWGLDVATSGSTVTYKADTSKLATLTDIGGFFTLPTFTAGSVIFSNGTTLAQDNSNLFWNNTTKRLGIGTATPSALLHLKSGGTDYGTDAIDIRNSANRQLMDITSDGRFYVGPNTGGYYSFNATIPSSGAPGGIGLAYFRDLSQAGTPPGLGFYQGSTSMSLALDAASGRMYFGNTGVNTQQLVLNTANNRFGIGVDPSYTLQVNGNGYFSNQVGIGGYTTGDALTINAGITSGGVPVRIYNWTPSSDGLTAMSFTGTSTAPNYVNGMSFIVNGSAKLQNLFQNTVSAVSLRLESGDDPYINLNTNGQDWSLGVDKSDANKLKISGGNGVGSSDKITVTTSDRIGILQTNPSYTLDVSGDFRLTDRSGTPQYNAAFDSNGKLVSTGAAPGSGSFTLPTLTNGSVIFSNGTTLAEDNANFYWDDTNNRLGIGNASPSAKIDITSGTSYGDVGIRSTGGFVVRGDGRIDVGGSTGFNTLFVVNRTTGNPVTGLANFNNDDGHDLNLFSNSTYFNLSLSGASGKMAFGNTGFLNEQLILDTATGRLGIGNTSPSYTLDVTGDVRITSRSGTPQYNAAFDSNGKLVTTGVSPTSGTVTSIATTSPITGGTITSSGTIGIDNAAADGTTKGASTYTAADFNSSSGLISLDYTNGQASSGSTKGFLSSTDWTTFNNKGNGTVTSVGLTAGSGINISGTNPITTSGTMTISGTRLYPWDSGLWVSGDLYLRTNNTGTYPTITYSGGVIYYNLPSASSGQVLKYNGTGWAAGTDNTGTGVTSVTASSPLFSSGGATPNITIQSASGSQNGSLTSSDWTAFNNKMDAFYVAASGTAGVGVVGPLDQLTITAGTGISATRSLRNITVSSTVTNTDNQTLSWSSPNLSISGGNSVALPVLPSGSVNQTLRHDGSNWVASSLLKTGSSNFVDINSWPGTVISGSKLLVNGYLQYTASGYSATSLSGQDTYGGLTGVTVGSGLSLSSGSLSATDQSITNEGYLGIATAGGTKIRGFNSSGTGTGNGVGVTASNGIVVASGGDNSNGGDLTWQLTGQASALHTLSSNGLIARTGSGTVSARTITAGTGISVSNGDGVSANPTISTNQSVNYGAIYNSSFYSESWTTGTPKKITMSSTSASSGVSISSSVLTTSSSGDYEISYSVGLQHTSYADWYCACYNSSGSSSYGQTWTTSRRDGTSLRSTLSMSTIVPLSSGDTISLWCYPDTGSGNDSVFYPKLSIKKIN